MSQFPKKSSFEQEQERLFVPPPTPGIVPFPTPGVKKVAISRTAAKPLDPYSGPSYSELEDWYQTLNDLVHHRGGFVDEDAIVDLRDAIYRYLR
jgi:hypothetical protein